MADPDDQLIAAMKTNDIASFRAVMPRYLGDIHRIMYLCCLYGHIEFIQVVHANLNYKAAPLARMIISEMHMSDHINVIRALVLCNPDICTISIFQDKNTLLHMAVKDNYRKLFKILVAFGVDLDIINNRQQAAINIANSHDYYQYVVYLLAAGAKPLPVYIMPGYTNKLLTNGDLHMFLDKALAKAKRSIVKHQHKWQKFVTKFYGLNNLAETYLAILPNDLVKYYVLRMLGSPI